MLGDAMQGQVWGGGGFRRYHERIVGGGDRVVSRDRERTGKMARRVGVVSRDPERTDWVEWLSVEPTNDGLGRKEGGGGGGWTNHDRTGTAGVLAETIELQDVCVWGGGGGGGV